MYANLRTAAIFRGIAGYRLGAAVGMTAATFSRVLNGYEARDFTVNERKRLVELLGFKERWLFSRLSPRVLRRITTEGEKNKAG